MKILTNMADLQYHPRYSHIKATQKVWWTYWINWLSYGVNKDDGNRQTDRQTDRRTDAGDDNKPSAEEAEGKKWRISADRDQI